VSDGALAIPPQLSACRRQPPAGGPLYSLRN
jgi:hypothetical protein